MTMKSGAGDDPFADDTSDDDPESEQEQPQEPVREESATGQKEDHKAASDISDSSPEPSSDTEDSPEEPEIPRIMARSSVKENRDNVLQFFVTEETAQQEDAFERAVADALDIRVKDLMKLDLREAAYLVAMQHPEETADILNDWGYEYR